MGSMFLPLARRATLAKRLLVVAVAVHCLALVVDFGQLALVGQIESRTATIADVNSNDARQALVDAVSLAIYVLAAVAFVAWFHRAYTNATRLGATGLRHRTSLAVFAWFIPILALFWPKEIADDTWKATDPDLPAEAGDRWRDAKVPSVFACWWLAWIATNVLALMSRRLNGDHDLGAQGRDVPRARARRARCGGGNPRDGGRDHAVAAAGGACRAPRRCYGLGLEQRAVVRLGQSQRVVT
jgi:Domain of unknown function (DUF4328)